MSITQLQAVVCHCKKILESILHKNGNYELHDEHTIRELIALRKEQISGLKVDISSLKRQEKDKKELSRYISAIEMEINSIKQLNAKQTAQKCYLEQLTQKNKMKIAHQNQRINQIHRQHQIMQEFQFYIQESIKEKDKYEALRQKISQISSQMLQQKTNRSKILKQKQYLLKQSRSNNIIVQTKIAYLQNQISIQAQIINQINRIENQQTPYPTIQQQAFQILNREGQAIFNRHSDFDIWEKHQIKNLLQKRQFEQQKQRRKIGSISKQPILYTQNHEDNRTIKRRSFNHSADLKKIQKKEANQLAPPLSPGPIHFISKERMKEMQKNKRIRTKFTPTVSKQKVKSFIAQSIPEQQSSIAQSNHSILKVYEAIVKQKMQQNPSIVKFKRQGNKKKLIEDNRGVALQSQSFE